MPRIFDNIESSLLEALAQTLPNADRADFCVGYFNLRGWKHLARFVDGWDGSEAHRCRLLVGMQKLPREELREALSLSGEPRPMTMPAAVRLRTELAREFREQLTLGRPTAEDEVALQQLAAQLKAGKLVVKLFGRYPLHAKLYLTYRNDYNNPRVDYLGSSNLTLAGLAHQGELNVDVVEHDATAKLVAWFEERWADQFSLDISAELVQVLQESWAREELIPPYHIYLKMAYHLAAEARAGLAGFQIPKIFLDRMFEFQTAAVKIAAHHLNTRKGVLIGDVVGLGKTLMASALARIFEDDLGIATLIICPKNLVKMWEGYRSQYELRATVLADSLVTRDLPTLKRFRLVIIDESHNLRNREGKRYRVIADYIRENDSLCILLSATPYNKSYLDLASQLRLFLQEDAELGARPERQLRETGEAIFISKHQCSPRSLKAFEQSTYADDWRELMRLYLVRRTRGFIREHYAATDPASNRKYLTFADGTRSYFPTRQPVSLEFALDEHDPTDQYARLYNPAVVAAVNALHLPRYGLANHLRPTPPRPPTADEAATLADLSRAGKRLMGFCRTNLFKRLESSGHSFVLSLQRHVLRNAVFQHALANGLPVPIGTQDVTALDTRFTDEDPEAVGFGDEADGETEVVPAGTPTAAGQQALTRQAAEVYGTYRTQFQGRFRWLPADFFAPSLSKQLEDDTNALLDILTTAGPWLPRRDAKLTALTDLVQRRHGREKVLIFSQFADTVEYVVEALHAQGVTAVAAATGGSADPTALAWRFSPVSNGQSGRSATAPELRVLVATDVLSEGQNLQDCAVVVNYDLPWAIIRLVQRAGRVDRIGQQAETIRCYSFLPAEGIERIIRLRARVRQRLKENAEVVGTDEAFFEDDTDQAVVDLYNEKAGILDENEEAEVDLSSYAYQIWKEAISREPALATTIPNLPDVVFATRGHHAAPNAPAGVLLYVKNTDGNDALAWVAQHGRNVTESQFAILQAARCERDAPALPRRDDHHDLVDHGLRFLASEEQQLGGGLGSPRGARFRTFERLKAYAATLRGTLFQDAELERVLEALLAAPLREVASQALNRQLRAGIDSAELARIAKELHAEGRLCLEAEEREPREARIICSLGLVSPGQGG